MYSSTSVISIMYHWITSSQSAHSPSTARTLTFSPATPKYEAFIQAFISSSLKGPKTWSG